MPNKEKKILKFIGPIALIITALLWGFAFVAQKIGSDSIGPFTFNFYRFALSGIILAITYVIQKKCLKKEKKFASLAPVVKEHSKLWICIMCILVGVFMTCGAFLQQYGITITSSASIAGFITITYIIMVPLIGLLFKKSIQLKIWLCLIIALVGFGFIAIKEGFNFEFGDIILLLGALGYALQIVFIDLVGKYVDVIFLSACQFLVGALLSFIGKVIFEGFDLPSLVKAIPALLYVALGSCCLGSTLQILGQKHTPATVASLLMSLESVFGLIFSTIVLHEQMTLFEYIGCGLVFAASILAQIQFKQKKKEFIIGEDYEF